MINKVSALCCTLCGACQNICPKSCIAFSQEHEGSQYPVIDANVCIRCGLCERICPVLNPQSSKGAPCDQTLGAYAAINRDDGRRAISASGGIFGLLAEHVLGLGGVVCGVMLDDHFMPKHVLIRRVDELPPLQGSKYARSDMGMMYREIASHLKENTPVLFSGCPCQAAGLRSFLGKTSGTLFVVDFICHGTPSRGLLREFIDLQERRHGAPLRKLFFRHKAKGWHQSAMRMEFANGRVYSKSIADDPYMKAFLTGITQREVCYDCRFKGSLSGSDITLADFWGAELELPEMDDNKGISAVIVNTLEGERLLDAVRQQAMLVPVSLEKIVKYNPNYFNSTPKHPARNAFFAAWRSVGLKSAFRKHVADSLAQEMEKKLRRIARYCLNKIRGAI